MESAALNSITLAEHTEITREIGSCLGSVSQLINFHSGNCWLGAFLGGKWCVNAIPGKVLLGFSVNISTETFYKMTTRARVIITFHLLTSNSACEYFFSVSATSKQPYGKFNAARVNSGVCKRNE